MATYKLQIITPERVFFDGEVERMVLKGTEGELAVLQNHTPLTTTLSMGELKIIENKKNFKIATLLGGFAKIEPDKTVILTDAAEWPEEIDVERAMAAKGRAEKRIQDEKFDNARAVSSLQRALVRIEVSKTLENK